MNKSDRYLYGLDILRILSTVAVVIYHIDPDVLAGGYLAVCVFLVLHGYLFIVSNSNKKKFSIIRHFIKRTLRLYLPMAVVTAISIYALRLTPDIIWLNEKPETLSVLGCFNNWWQIAAGQSYFARVTNSPFTHMWYISMLLQVELLLPFIFKAYNWVRQKANFWLTWIPFLLLTVISMTVIPYLQSQKAADMRLYYATDARVFSILMGVTLAAMHVGGRRLNLKLFRKKAVTELLFLAKLALLVYMMFTVGVDSPLYKHAFTLSSLLTVLIIALCTNPEYPLYGTLRNPVTKLVGSISYEVYLVHYPILFYLSALTDFESFSKWKYAAIVIAVSGVLHFALSIKLKGDVRNTAMNVVKYAVLVPVVVLSIFGGGDIYLAQDHTEEMLELEKQLADNAEMLDSLQEEFLEKRQKESDILKDPQAMIKEADAANLPITGIGDSVMLGALTTLRKTFPNGDFDAKQNRSYYPLYSIIKSRVADNTLGNPVVIGIGTNAVMPKSTCKEIIKMCGDRYIYWITITNNWQFNNNDMIRALGQEHDNVVVVDWEKYSKGHPEYFYSDGIHLTPSGRKAYANFILETISKDLVSRKLLQSKQNQIMGIGDGFLLTSVDYLKESLSDVYIVSKENLDFSALCADIQHLKAAESLPKKIFLSLGSSKTISSDDLRQLFEELKDCRVLLIKMPALKGNETNKNIDELLPQYSNILVRSWQDMYNEKPEYFSPDRIHFNETGSKALADFILKEVERLNE